MKEILGKKYKWNDELQQYEFVELGRKKGDKVKKSNNKIYKDCNKKKNIGGLAVKSGTQKPRPVILKHEKYGVCFTFPSLNECARKLGCHAIDVSKHIESGQLINGFIVEEKIDCKELEMSVKNDLESMAEIISALKSGKEVYRKKKSGGDWERVKCGMCDFVNYDYKIGSKLFDICVSTRISEDLKNKLDELVERKGLSVNALFKDKLREIIINELTERN